MADKITLNPKAPAFIGADSGSWQPVKTDISDKPVYPFLEDADTLNLQAASEAMGQSKKPNSPTQIKDSSAALIGPIGIFLLIVLGLALIALVSTSAYLLLDSPQRLQEIVAGISSLFSR